MQVQFVDLDGDLKQKINISSSADLARLLDSMQDRDPFIGELRADNGFKLSIGIGGKRGCAQFSRTDGDPPYLMALAADNDSAEDCSFLIADTPTEIEAKHCLLSDKIKQIAMYFVETGEQSPSVEWESI